MPMMTITVELNTSKALKLLQDLEDLNLLRILAKDESASPRLSEKYAGKLPVDIAMDIQKHIKLDREEWSRDI